MTWCHRTSTFTLYGRFDITRRLRMHGMDSDAITTDETNDDFLYAGQWNGISGAVGGCV